MTANLKSKPSVVVVEGLLVENRELFKELLRESLQEALAAEMTEAIGAEPGERSADRVGYRAGYYSRSLVTRIGKLELRAAPRLRPMPLVVLSSDESIGQLVKDMAANGQLPAGVPADFGYVTENAQRASQAGLAALVPGARHVKDTNSGHNIHREQPQLVVEAIRNVVDAVREGRDTLAR